MLGLGSSCNSEEGYAKGERYRERYHTGGTYHHVTNPIGKGGSESDYMGGFTKAADDDLYTTTDVTLNISSSVLRIRASANDGFASILRILYHLGMILMILLLEAIHLKWVQQLEHMI